MSFTTVPAAGAKLRASTLTSLFTELRPLAARVGSTQGLTTSSTTLQNVTDLVVTPSINQTYLGWLVVIASNAAGTTEDIRIGCSFPTGASCRWQVLGGTTAGITGGTASDLNVQINNMSSGTSFFSFGASTTQTAIFIRLLLFMGSTAGNFQIMAAQDTSGGNVTSINVGSTLELQQAF